MHSLARLLALLAAGLALAAPLAGQVQHEHGPAVQQLGRVSFSISCNAEAQRRFERALALLHSFWWEEAESAFPAVAEADSSCAMAYWGLALNYWRNPFAGGPSAGELQSGAAAAERAAALGAPTRRERDYIAAVNALYRDHATLRHPARLRAYSDSMEQAYRRNSGDPEAAIFYALSLVATASPTDTTFERQRRAAAILNPLFRRYPQHPGLAHYIIHANDSPRLAHLGLDAARRYARIAPVVPHAQHMPSHIFIRLGLWEENITSNRASYDAGAAYARSQHPEALGSHEFHAMDYMVYGYLQQGRDSAALSVTGGALAASRVIPAVAQTTDYARAAMPARLALERGRWREAAQLTVRPSTQFPWTEGITHFARGIGAARSGDTALARSELRELARIEAELTRRPEAYWARVMAIKRQAVEAWIALAAADTATALSEAAAAADLEDVTEKHPVTPGEVLPARELYGDLLLEAGRPGEAQRAYDATLTREPGRARSIFGAARAAELAGDRAAARTRYREFLNLMSRADGNRPELAAARAYLERR